MNQKSYLYASLLIGPEPSKADTLAEDGLLAWVGYFLSGLKNQIEKIRHLTSRNYTRDKILLPALTYALERQYITKEEDAILTYLVKQQDMAMKASELDRFGLKNSHQKSYVMGKLRDKKVVKATTSNGRTYTINFVNSYLLRSVIKSLTEQGFIAEFLDKN